MNICDRFLSYAKISTNSDSASAAVPSTGKQMVLLKKLYDECMEAGLSDVRISNEGYVYAKLESNTDKPFDKIGFIAHVDTSQDMSDENINPQIKKNYKGGDIILNSEQNIVLSPMEYPELDHYIGNDLIVTDGTTLLGADDKAGVAEIMDFIIRLKNSGDEHGDIMIAFTPDEEIGRGTDYFDIKGFGADYAYTVDGGRLGEIEYENFNAASGRVEISGNSIHPGTSKNKMINSIHIGYEFNSLLPVFDRPEYTENYEGFYHLHKFEGGVEKSKMEYLIRDHDKEKFEKRKAAFTEAADYINKKYKKELIKTEIKDSYYNMREIIEPEYRIVENIVKAMEESGVEPIIMPIRGGTDGAQLSYKGLPCPNICVGGGNFHGKYEYVSVQAMEKVSEILYRIAVNGVGC